MSSRKQTLHNDATAGMLAGVLLLLASCVQLPVLSAKPETRLLEEILGDPAQLPVRVSTLALNDTIRARIDRQIDREWPNRRKLDALRKLIFAEDQLALQYDTSSTRTAIETFEARRGNCLSLTNLFIAMARHVDLPARFHMVPTLPWWDANANTLIWNEHINATGLLHYSEAYVLDFVPEPAAPLKNKDRIVSDQYAEALYYNNLGAEALEHEENAMALAQLRRALAIEPTLANAWNNMAIAQNRLGRPDLGEAALLQALQIDAGHQTAMSNLANLYERTGKPEAAAQYRERVRRYRESNPFFLYGKATIAIKDGEIGQAISLLDKAIRLDPERPEFYLARHRAHRLAGNERRSARDLELAGKARLDAARGPMPGTQRVIKELDQSRFRLPIKHG